jgi:hypothetical protein
LTLSSLVTNKETNEKYYFIHEITNDYSDIGFDKLTKIIEKNKVILNLGNLENLPKVEKDIPNETSEVLKITHASKRNTQTYHQKDRSQQSRKRPAETPCRLPHGTGDDEGAYAQSRAVPEISTCYRNR